MVKIFMFLLFPACKPIAWLLDKALGAELPTVYSKKELELILRAHEKSDRSGVDADDAKIAIGALTYSDKTVADVMTPADDVVGLEQQMPMDADQLRAIKGGGNSRLPVWDQHRHNVVGVLHIRSLIGVSGAEGHTVGDLDIAERPLCFAPETPLDQAMRQYLQAGHDFAVVRAADERFVGLMTMEDILEEIIQEDILDDDDYAP